MKKTYIWLTQNYLSIITPLILLSIWELSSRLNLIENTFLPPPSLILKEFFILLLNGELIKNLLISIIRVAEGFFIGVSLGIIVGIQVALNKNLQKAVRFIFGILRPIPVIAWIPVLILWLGIDESSKVAAISIGSFWSVLVSVVQAIKNVDKKYLEVAKVLRKDYKTILLKVILPSTLPQIFTGIRIGIDVAWRSVIAAELIAASAGIGYMIMYARELFQIDIVLVGVFSIGLTGIIIEELLKILEHHLLRWNTNIYQEEASEKP
ncbi:ABC transporter permease [Pectinatus cerevisiiphilus]|uniref:Sulfonate transport system permease protein n=1 Tax=Pectinatus cerevisiiphilus TaxID=86956 RepID=A0A4R3KAZ4_9FIRM|nr:ABC transporter permease [Pectinatus cerevisiiphilus]TCS80099.1 sulfonate transport system permease protein [Pectinatus cerevisiiphilus]